MSTQKFIARNALMVAFIMGLSTLLGLTRESSIAYMFGASGTTDAYLIASIIPMFFSGTIANSLTSTFITVYASYLAKGEEEKAWRTTNIVFSLFILLLGALGLLSLIFTPFIVHLLAPSYVGSRLSLTVDLTRIMLPNLFFGGLLGILVGVNNAHHSFLAPSSIGLISNVFIISSIFTLGWVWGIYGLAAGAALGVLGQFLLQVPSARKHGFHYRFLLDFKDPGVQEIFRLVTPFIISATVGQVNLIVDRTLATGLPAGRVSALYFSSKLVLLPQTIFAGAVGMVVYPLLVNAAALEDWPRLVEGLNRAVRLLMLVLFPAIVGLYVLRVPLVQMLFQHGVFNSNDTRITSETVPYLLGVLFSGSMVMILVNVYFALKKMTVAVGTGAISLLLNIALSILLVRFLQQRGLALANSISGLANLVLLFLGFFVVLKLQEKTPFPFRSLRVFAWQVGGAGGLMGAVVYLANTLLYGRWAGLKGLIVSTLLSVVAGLMVYLVLTYVFRVEEVRKGIGWARGKLGGAKREERPGRDGMRKVHRDARIVGLTLVIALVIIATMYFWTKRGFAHVNNPVATGSVAVQTESGQPTGAVLPGTPSSGERTGGSSLGMDAGQPAKNGQNAPAQLSNTKIVTVGDSFTYGNPFSPQASWPHWVANRLGVDVVNNARIGQTSRDVLTHFDRDVLAYNPGRVIIFVGDGDAIKRVSEADYQNDIEAMVEKAWANNITPILALPVPYRGLSQPIGAMRKWLTAYAKEQKIQTLDFASVLFDSQGNYLPGMSNDGKYPSLQGYRAMGEYAAQVLEKG